MSKYDTNDGASNAYGSNHLPSNGGTQPKRDDGHADCEGGAPVKDKTVRITKASHTDKSKVKHKDDVVQSKRLIKAYRAEHRKDEDRALLEGYRCEQAAAYAIERDAKLQSDPLYYEKLEVGIVNRIFQDHVRYVLADAKHHNTNFDALSVIETMLVPFDEDELSFPEQFEKAAKLGVHVIDVHLLPFDSEDKLTGDAAEDFEILERYTSGGVPRKSYTPAQGNVTINFWSYQLKNMDDSSSPERLQALFDLTK